MGCQEFALFDQIQRVHIRSSYSVECLWVDSWSLQILRRYEMLLRKSGHTLWPVQSEERNSVWSGFRRCVCPLLLEMIQACLEGFYWESMTLNQMAQLSMKLLGSELSCPWISMWEESTSSLVYSFVNRDLAGGWEVPPNTQAFHHSFIDNWKLRVTNLDAILWNTVVAWGENSTFF